MGAFLAPIFLIMVINVIFFIWVIVVVIRHTKETAKRMKQTVSNKQILRIMFSISGVLFLFGLTWLFFVFTFSLPGLRETFQILFTVFNSLQGFFVFAFILFTEGFGYWKKAFLSSCKKYKSNSSQPGTNNVICTMKSGISPCTLPRQEKNTSDTSHLKTTDSEMINTNGQLGLKFSSETLASSNELMVCTCDDIPNLTEDQVNHRSSTTMDQNDQEHNFQSEQHLDHEGEIKEPTKPLKIFIHNRYSTKRYKKHHVEEIRIEFYDEDSSSGDEDHIDA